MGPIPDFFSFEEVKQFFKSLILKDNLNEPREYPHPLRYQPMTGWLLRYAETDVSNEPYGESEIATAFYH